MRNFQVKAVFSTAALIALTGCNQAALPDLMSTGSVLGPARAPAHQHTLTQKRPVQEAFLQLPPSAGQVLDVTQSYHGNGVEQLIIYKGDYETRGENAAKVRLVTKQFRPGKNAENISIPPTSARQISREMRKTLPGIAMEFSNRLHTNAYGPFGYALGNAPGNVRCIYGWQNMKGSSSDRWAKWRGASAKPQLSVRLRVCRHNAPDQQLVNLMRNLRIEADPAKAVRPTAVTWNSGSNADLTTAMPQYDAQGYVSDQLRPEPEDYAQKAVAPVKKPVRKRVRKPRKSQTVRATRKASPPPTTAIYNPPLPGNIGANSTVSSTYGVVPKPSGSATQVVVTPSSPKPVATLSAPAAKLSLNTSGNTSGGQPLVPLPN